MDEGQSGGDITVSNSVSNSSEYESDEPYLGPRPPRGPERPGVNSSPYGDVDRNRVYDEVDRIVANAVDGERIPVIVRFQEPTSDAFINGLSRQHENFTTTGRFNQSWGSIHGFAADLTPRQIEQLSKRLDVLQIESNAAFNPWQKPRTPLG